MSKVQPKSQNSNQANDDTIPAGFPTVKLAKIGEKQVPSVDGRNLHASMRVKTAIKDWAARRIEEAQLVENVDFVCCSNLSSEGRGGHNRIDYLFTVQAAKHMAMLERTDRGREVRQHFIEIEELWQAGQQAPPQLDEKRVVNIVVSVVEQMMPRLLEAAIRNDNRIAAVDSVGAREVCDELGVPSKGRSGLIRSVTSKLQKFSAKHGHVVRMAQETGRYLYTRVAVLEWRTKGAGDAFVSDWLAKRAANAAKQIVIPFPKRKRSASEGGAR